MVTKKGEAVEQAERVSESDLAELRETFGALQEAQQLAQTLREQAAKALEREVEMRGAHQYVYRRVFRAHGLTEQDTIALADGAITRVAE